MKSQSIRHKRGAGRTRTRTFPSGSGLVHPLYKQEWYGVGSTIPGGTVRGKESAFRRPPAADEAPPRHVTAHDLRVHSHSLTLPRALPTSFTQSGAVSSTAMRPAHQHFLLWPELSAILLTLLHRSNPIWKWENSAWNVGKRSEAVAL